MNKELTFNCLLCSVGIMVVDTLQVKESTFSETRDQPGVKQLTERDGVCL